MAFVTTTKDVKSFRKELKKNGVFYSDPKLAEALKSYLPADLEEVYDPTCGNGALLSVFPDNVKKYGQELDEEQAIEAGERLTNAVILPGNTLKDPQFKDKKFRGIIANPPFSVYWEQMPDDERFNKTPLAPKSKADYAFILHCLHYLADDGKAAILDAHGILFRGSAEGKIRQWLIDNNYIERVIGFDKGFFVDTSIPTCALILNKHKDTTDIYIEDTVINMGRAVPLEEVKENDYNLNIPRYVRKPEERIEYNYEEEARNAREVGKEALRAELEFQFMCTKLEYNGKPLTGYKEYIEDLRKILDEAERRL